MEICVIQGVNYIIKDIIDFEEREYTENGLNAEIIYELCKSNKPVYVIVARITNFITNQHSTICIGTIKNKEYFTLFIDKYDVNNCLTNKYNNNEHL